MLRKIFTFSLVTLPALVSYAALPECLIIEKQNIKNLPVTEIKSYIQSVIFEQHTLPALMIGIMDGDQKIVFSCGETVKGNGTQPQMDTVWPIGSVSKVFTTQMLVEMVNQGSVQLNSSIDDLLENKKQRENPITLLNLATHTASFPRQLPTLPENDDYQENIVYNMPEFISWYNTFKPEFKPGTHYDYSNVGFGLLGQLLAKKMNTDFGGLLEQLIAKPLGLKDTTTALSTEQKKREVASYWLNGDLIKKDWPFAFEQPSGGIYSTMTDMLQFTRYQLSHLPGSIENTRLAHASYIYQYQLDNPHGFDSDAMALGWSVDFPSHGLPLQLMKNGWVNGVNTYVQLSPTEDIGLISLTNKPYLNINTDLKKLVAIILAAREKPAKN